MKVFFFIIGILVFFASTSLIRLIANNIGISTSLKQTLKVIDFLGLVITALVMYFIFAAEREGNGMQISGIIGTIACAYLIVRTWKSK